MRARTLQSTTYALFVNFPNSFTVMGHRTSLNKEKNSKKY